MVVDRIVFPSNMLPKLVNTDSKKVEGIATIKRSEWIIASSKLVVILIFDVFSLQFVKYFVFLFLARI